MRKFAVLLVAIGLTAILAGEASAQGQRQRQGGGRGGFGGQQQMGVMLITNKSVQEELKLTDDQKKPIDEKMTEFRAGLREKMTELAAKSREERDAEMKKMTEPISKLVDETLKPDQLKRFKQIQKQVAGPVAFTEEDVAKELKLNDDQKTKVKGLVDDMKKDLADLMPMRGAGGGGGGARPDMTEINKKREAIRKETTDKAVEILTPDQKKVWKDMTGEHFDYKPDAFGGRKKNTKDDI